MRLRIGSPSAPKRSATVSVSSRVIRAMVSSTPPVVWHLAKVRFEKRWLKRWF